MDLTRLVLPSPFLRPSTARRLGFWVLLGAITVLIASLGFLLQGARSAILDLTTHSLATAVGAGTQAIAARTGAVESTARMAAATFAHHLDDPELIETLLSDIALSHPDIQGITAAFEPGVVRGHGGGYAPFFRQQNNEPVRRDLADDGGSPYREATWYRRALGCPAGCWGRIFHSQSRNAHIINFGVPIRRADGLVVGILNADVPQQWLQGVMDGIRLGEASRAFVLDENGTFLTNAMPERIATSIFELADKSGSPELAAVTRRMLARETDSTEYLSPTLRVPVRTFYAPIPGSGWSMAIVVPQDAFAAQAHSMFLRTIAIGTTALAALGLLVWFSVRRLLAPLEQLADKADHIAHGELDFRLEPPKRLDEVGLLTQSFIGMRDKLKRHIIDLTDATAQRERLQSELDIAQRIQASMLPPTHHVRNGRCGFELRALLRPAKTIGGDLYAWFMPHGQRLCFLIGDVSDKGIPAALFMARTITMAAQASAQAGAAQAPRPDRLLRKLNAGLCGGNDNDMFVTMLCCVLDLDSGALTLASAGHDAPLRVDTHGPTAIEAETGGALGLYEGMEFPCSHTVLAPGDRLVLYTDGVTEARDKNDAMFGEQRLRDVLAAHKDAAPGALVEAITAAVDAFAHDAPPADDLTLLVLEWHGGAVPHRLDFALRGTLAATEAALDRIDAWLADGGTAIEPRADIRLALEELLVNTINYGCRGAMDAPRIELALDRADGKLTATLTDDAIAFDPFAVAEPDFDPDPAREGGFGVFLVRRLADAYAWRRNGEGNRVELSFLLDKTKRGVPA